MEIQLLEMPHFDSSLKLVFELVSGRIFEPIFKLFLMLLNWAPGSSDWEQSWDHFLHCTVRRFLHKAVTFYLGPGGAPEYSAAEVNFFFYLSLSPVRPKERPGAQRGEVRPS